MKNSNLNVIACICLATFFGARVSAAITTSGEITNNETWSGTIVLTGDVTVTPTGNLTILPGTRIEADPRADDQAGGTNSSRVELVIDNGSLSAVGTELNPILFTVGTFGTNPPAKGDWYGIRVKSSLVTMRYCVVEYGKEGLRAEGGSPLVENCSFRKNEMNGVGVMTSLTLSSCTAQENQTGVNVYSSTPTSLVLTNCTFRQNTTGLGCGVTNFILGCAIQGNFGNGVSISHNWGYQKPTFLLAVSQSTISANLGNGLEAYGDPWGSAAPIFVTISESLLSSNAGAGFTANASPPLRVDHTQVTDNLGRGLAAGDTTMENCTIANNGGGRVRCQPVHY